MQLKPVVSLWLDTRYLMKSRLYQLKVRVSFSIKDKQVQKYYSTKIELSPQQWDKMLSESVPQSLRKMKDTALKLKAKANEIIDANPRNFNPELFEALFIGKYSGKTGISVLFEEEVSRLESEGRIATASAYRCAMKSLVEYRGDFPFDVVDVEFLEKYERWMMTPRTENKVLIKGKSVTTVGFYLRAFRSIFNLATERRLVSKDLYPFGPKKYVIPKGSNFKKALSRKEKTLLGKVKGKGPEEKRAVAMWMFSYFCNGMNFTDMAHLRPEDIHQDVIVFVRRKTIRTVRQVKPIVVPIRPEVRLIIKEYGQNEPYIFGVISEEMSPKERYSKIQYWIKLTNRHVNNIAGSLGVIGKVNTYSARHTFATALLEGANIKEISESLGHSSTTVTEAYLKGLDLEKAKKLSKLL